MENDNHTVLYINKIAHIVFMWSVQCQDTYCVIQKYKYLTEIVCACERGVFMCPLNSILLVLQRIFFLILSLPARITLSDIFISIFFSFILHTIPKFIHIPCVMSTEFSHQVQRTLFHKAYYTSAL